MSLLVAVVPGLGTWSQSTLASALLDPGDGQSMAHCLGWQYRHCHREDLGYSPRNVLGDSISHDIANAPSSVGGGAAAHFKMIHDRLVNFKNVFVFVWEVIELFNFYSTARTFCWMWCRWRCLFSILTLLLTVFKILDGGAEDMERRTDRVSSRKQRGNRWR